MPGNEMSVVEHLEELRKRLIIILAAVSIVSTVFYCKINVLVGILSRPLEKFKLDIVFFALTEGFTTRLKISVIAGLIAMSPVVFHQIFAFVSPGLTRKEKRLVFGGVISISILFILGILFGYWVLLPVALNFLIPFGQSYLNAALSGNKYFSFIGMFCVGIGVTFIIPLFIILLGKLGFISFKLLNKFRFHVVLVIIAVEGLFVPAMDFVSFGIMAAPIVVLYEISVWTVFFIEKARKKALV